MHECVMSLMEHILFFHSILASSEFWLLLKFFFRFPPHIQYLYAMPHCFLRTLIARARFLVSLTPGHVCKLTIWFYEWESTPFIIIPISYPRCEGNYPPPSTLMCLLLQRQKSFWGPKNCWRVFWMWNIFRVYLPGRKLFNKKGGNRLIFQLMFSLQLIYTLLFSFLLCECCALIRSPPHRPDRRLLFNSIKFQT